MSVTKESHLDLKVAAGSVAVKNTMATSTRKPFCEGPAVLPAVGLMVTAREQERTRVSL